MKLRNKLIVIMLACNFMYLNSGCKKFLNVDPLSALSGNNFWKTPADFDNYMAGIYNQFRSYTMMDEGNTYTQFFPAIGDFRCAPFTGVNTSNRNYINQLANNDLKGVINSTSNWVGTYARITDWTRFFQIISSCNILVDEIGKSEGVLSEKQRGQFKGEAVFMRNLSYFYMARLFGDIPYYTDPYRTDPSAREDMVAVLNKCMADMGSAVDGLPWTYDDPSKRGVRAMKGAGLDLMMEINMWCAGFDAPNQEKYWAATDSLGEVLLTKNGGSYELLPMERFHEVFEGNSKEGLFEIAQSLNKGEVFGLFSTFTDNMLHYPHKQNGSTRSYLSIDRNFLYKMFPKDKPDQRWSILFTDWDNADPFAMEYLKFSNIYAEEGEDVNPDDNQLIFRLPDAILLRAEACDKLGKKAEAIKLLDMVRNRAGATPYVDGETPNMDLSDAIFMERWKELFGEGYYFFDLVRTKRILDGNFCAHPISAEAFSRGAWTWPISEKALIKNPGMRLNDYWR
ncbi:MAG TPA: RagB/SusD family nutrient uptake outer membrane protein [Arachidicoccus sp.]|nr:RagB/SusD family nutrient uptake outer membrane protein [Arachidicoccus sp.]